jgi:eukaryotic-like serine/threonine-protein kinase
LLNLKRIQLNVFQMFSKISYLSFIALFMSLLFSSCIEQAVRYNNEPENETIFVGSSDKNIYALDAHTGAKKWNIEVNSGIIHGPILVDSIMYIVCADRNMYAYNYLKKTKKWTSVVGIVAIFSYLNGLLYIRNTDKKFKAFDTNSGIKLWESDIYDGVDSIPAIGTDVVLIRTAANNLQAFDAQAGTKKWSRVLQKDFKSCPTVIDGTSFYYSDSLHAVDNSTGKKKWSYFTGVKKDKIGGKYTFYNSPINAIAYSAGLLYFADKRDTLIRRIKADSATIKGVSYGGIANVNALKILNGNVYAFTNGGGLVAIDTSLVFSKWKLSIDTKLPNELNIISGIIFTGSYNRTFYTIDSKTGTKKWTFETADNAPALSTFANDIVFISSQDGNVNAIEVETGKVKWTFKTNGKIYTKPVVLTVDRKVF